MRATLWQRRRIVAPAGILGPAAASRVSTRLGRLAILTPLFLLVSTTRLAADAGTPLMWAGILHLAIGNLVIGIAEGLAIEWPFVALSFWQPEGDRSVASCIVLHPRSVQR